MQNDRRSSYFKRLLEKIRETANWFVPGIGVKRWVLTIIAGTTMLGVGLGIVILDIYRTAPDTWWLPALSWLSLRFLPRLLRAIIFGGIGVAIVLMGVYKLNQSIISPFISPGEKVASTLRKHRQRDRGPRVVAIGGGHGLATLLRGMKTYTNNITAIVTVADDGGSSGRLRQELGVLPPGDVRNCLAALSDDEALITQLFQYRFPDGGSNLDGHSFGNLFITAMAEITGSFETAIAESGRVLRVVGRVLPSTLHNVRLEADIILPNSDNEVRILGESAIPRSNGKVRRVWIEPGNPSAYPQSIQAILSADLIVIGPGSLYTSILPNLLVPDLVHAIRASRALKLYICNVATERGETSGMGCGEHIRIIEEHVSPGLFDLTIANDHYQAKLPEAVEWVKIEPDLDQSHPIQPANLVDGLYPWRHDAAKLAQLINNLYLERTGPLVE